jgi:mRNA-degrading endonuclease RelE of RelBE toxin-antitoxin system
MEVQMMKKIKQYPVQKAIYISREMAKEVKRLAKKEQVTFTEFVRGSLQAAVERYAQEEVAK